MADALASAASATGKRESQNDRAAQVRALSGAAESDLRFAQHLLFRLASFDQVDRRVVLTLFGPLVFIRTWRVPISLASITAEVFGETLWPLVIFLECLPQRFLGVLVVMAHGQIFSARW